MAHVVITIMTRRQLMNMPSYMSIHMSVRVFMAVHAPKKMWHAHVDAHATHMPVHICINTHAHMSMRTSMHVSVRTAVVRCIADCEAPAMVDMDACVYTCV